ncbi:MAG: prepilin-type N-terminal cleavage/methylation domain-containing protein [Phycisphaerae bacterium]|nr:prepilin-type N-terminal cleavage/methylation domain-containing protein [Phycisphaerae bacterium]
MKNKGFTLIELLTVIAIITILISILMPALNQARYQGKNVVDMSNLKQIGLAAWTWSYEHDDWSLSSTWYADEALAKITNVDLKNAYSPGAQFTKQQKNNLYVCPLAAKEKFFGLNPPDIISYGINGSLALKDNRPVGNDLITLTGNVKLTAVKNPATTHHFMCHEKWVIIGDINFDPAIAPASLPDPTKSRWHRIRRGKPYGTANIVWVDGHVSKEPEDFESRWRKYLSIN